MRTGGIVGVNVKVRSSCLGRERLELQHLEEHRSLNRRVDMREVEGGRSVESKRQGRTQAGKIRRHETLEVDLDEIEADVGTASHGVVHLAVSPPNCDTKLHGAVIR